MSTNNISDERLNRLFHINDLEINAIALIKQAEELAQLGKLERAQVLHQKALIQRKKIEEMGMEIVLQ